MAYTRREMLAVIGATGLAAAVRPMVKSAAAAPLGEPVKVGNDSCPFRLAVINDEITQDFEKACQIVSRDFGLHWIELRSMWNKNVTELDARQVEDARKILDAHKLRVTDIASPLFKTDWPGAPDRRKAKPATSFMLISMPKRRISCWSVVSHFASLSTLIAFAVSTIGGWMIRSRIARPLTRNCSRLPNAAPR